MAINGWIDVKTQHKDAGGLAQISVEQGFGEGVFLQLGDENCAFLSRKKAVRLALAILKATHDVDELDIDGVTLGLKK